MACRDAAFEPLTRAHLGNALGLKVLYGRGSMTPGLRGLLIAWGIVTGSLIILLSSMLTMQEDDQLFLDESSTAMATEQKELIAKVNRINPLVKVQRRD